MSQRVLQLSWPQNKAFFSQIMPIFIPFAGCEQRCIFCAQHLQSGTVKESSFHNCKKQRYYENMHSLTTQCKSEETYCEQREHQGQQSQQGQSSQQDQAYWQYFPSLLYSEDSTAKSVLERTLAQLHHRARQGLSSPQIAFYGGTFTALPEEDFQLCCTFVQAMRQQGLITCARCSTRPDALSAQRLKIMKDVGFTCVELGVQSFDDAALMQAKRHYTEEIVRKACAYIHEQGFTLGVQLMPGMPGVTPTVFLQDVTKALRAQAHFLRFYPCQVIAGTELAQMWREQTFSPWNLTETVQALSEGWLAAHLAGVPVIRMGLAPEASLEEHILAGPRHASLGSMVQGQALHTYIVEALGQNSVHRLTLPKACQGYFWGQNKSLEDAWLRLKVQKSNLDWHDKEHIELIYR